MKYYLSSDQWNILLKKLGHSKRRLHEWNNIIQQQYHLSYSECKTQHDSGYWGVLEGDEHHITMFLLTL